MSPNVNAAIPISYVRGFEHEYINTKTHTEVTAVRFREIATRLRVVNKRVAVVAMIPTGGE